MGKKDQQNESEKDRERVEAVLDLVRKQAPLTLKQRFLKSKGDNVKKAVKQLRACLSWRESIGIERLMADEFSAELAEGVAYVAGQDEGSRPVVIFRIKQDYHKSHSQKMFTRLLVFTLEVAMQTMPKNVKKFVLLFDASFYRSGSAFMNTLVATLKMIADYYPGRVHKVFVIDPPSLFSYLWKGVRAFVELSPLTTVVSSLDFDDSMDLNDDFSFYPGSSSLRFNPSTAKVGSCSSSRFSFAVSPHLDSLKPWCLTLTDTSASKNARGNINSYKNGLFPSTPLPQKTQKVDPASIHHPRTPKPSFLQSPATFFRKDCHVTCRPEKPRESFLPFLKFYRRPYDEATYRSKMRPP
ncbi:hypothetical protein C3L33_14913, partial [Rhododendron williamsianum]